MDVSPTELGAAELRGIHQRLGCPPSWLLVEISATDSGPRVAARELRPREWAHDGFARGADTPKLWPLADPADLLETVADWRESLRPADGAGGVALVFDAEMHEPVQELRAALETPLLEDDRVGFVTLLRRGPRLYLNARESLSAEPVPDLSDRFELVLEARNRLAWAGPRWPVLVGLDGFGVDRRHALVRVLARSPESTASPLPREAWFQVERLTSGQAAGLPRLRVEVEPGLKAQDDRWVVRWEVPGTGEVRRVAPPAQAVGDDAPTVHLGVIFDRTCPDADAWPQARWLLVNPSANRAAGAPGGVKADLEALFDEPGTPAAAVPGPFRLEDCNRALRTEIGRALRDNLPRLQRPASRVVIHPFWFADTATAEFDPLEQDEINRAVAGSLAPFRASEPQLDTLFGVHHYVPSFDVSDPLESALHDAVESLERTLASALRTAPAQAAIVIVGNSPPVFSDDDDQREQTALQRFWRVAGMRFGSRPRPGVQRRWSEVLRAAERAGLPVVYVFLTLDAGAADAAGDWLKARPDRMKQVEECVRASLADFCEIHLPHAVAATPEGLRAGLASAFDHLAAEICTGHSALTLTR